LKILRAFLYLLFFVTSIQATPLILKSVNIKGGDLEIVFNKDYDKKAIRYFALSNPPRKVFDMPNTILSKYAKKSLSYSKCRAIRVAQYNRDTVRVVIETDKPYRCKTYRPLLDSNIYCIPLPKSNLNTTPKKTDTPKQIVKKSRDVIVIDAGHGGHDTGAIGAGKREKDLVLIIAKKVERELKKLGYRVYLTRRRDVFLKLKQRTRVADKKHAKVFVSIHANSVPRRLRNRAYGIETYFLQKSRDAKSQLIAEKENSAVLKGAKTSLSKKVIIDSVLNGPKIVQSNKLAIDVQKNIIYYLRQHYSNIKNGGVRPAPFYVLVGASRPSILVEVGYISHYKERKRLFTSRYQNYIAKGIAKGIDSYLKNRKRELDL